MKIENWDKTRGRMKIKKKKLSPQLKSILFASKRNEKKIQFHLKMHFSRNIYVQIVYTEHQNVYASCSHQNEMWSVWSCNLLENSKYTRRIGEQENNISLDLNNVIFTAISLWVINISYFWRQNKKIFMTSVTLCKKKQQTTVRCHINEWKTVEICIRFAQCTFVSVCFRAL